MLVARVEVRPGVRVLGAVPTSVSRGLAALLGPYRAEDGLPGLFLGLLVFFHHVPAHDAACGGLLGLAAAPVHLAVEAGEVGLAGPVEVLVVGEDLLAVLADPSQPAPAQAPVGLPQAAYLRVEDLVVLFRLLQGEAQLLRPPEQFGFLLLLVAQPLVEQLEPALNSLSVLLLVVEDVSQVSLELLPVLEELFQVAAQEGVGPKVAFVAFPDYFGFFLELVEVEQAARHVSEVLAEAFELLCYDLVLDLEQVAEAFGFDQGVLELVFNS